MTKIAVWCRHAGDNIIGIGPAIPWKILSDFKRFRRITEGKTLVAGEKTYESFPNRTLPNRKIFVLTFNSAYEVSDPTQHFIVTDIKKFREFDGDLYISGGAGIYKAFMCGGDDKLMPDIVVDSMYKGDIDPNLKGEKIEITPCIDAMNLKYTQISDRYETDNVETTVWIKKGAFVDQSVLKHLITAIEADGEK